MEQQDNINQDTKDRRNACYVNSKFNYTIGIISTLIALLIVYLIT